MYKVAFTLFILLTPILSFGEVDTNFAQDSVRAAIDELQSINYEENASSQTLRKALSDLGQIKGYVSNEKYLELFKKAEPLLYKEYKNPKDREVIFFFITLNNANNPWIFSKRIDEIFSYLDTLSSDVSQELRVLNYIQQFNRYQFLDQQDASLAILVKASKEIASFPRSPSIWKDLTFFFTFCINEKRLMYSRATGNLDEARQYNTLLDKEFDEMIKVTFNVLRYEQSRFDSSNETENLYRAITLLAESIEYDKFLGKYDETLRKSDLLLKMLDPYSNNKFILKSRGFLLGYKSEVYAKQGNDKARLNEYKEAIQAEIRSGDLGTKHLIEYIYLSIGNDESTKANFYIDSLEKQLLQVEPDEQLIYKGLIPMLREYTKTRSETIGDKTTLNQAFSSKAAEWQEKIYFQLIESKPSVGLDLIYGIAKNFSNANDKYMAVIYAKLYINTLQNVRSKLSEIKDPNLTTFTEVHSSRLKEFSNLFFEVGDYETSFKCFKIIKENEFLDFVRRTGVPDKFLSTIDFSQQENDYVLQMKLLCGQASSIEKQLDKVDSPEQLKILQVSLLKTKSEILLLKKSLSLHLKELAVNKKNTEVLKFHQINKLGNNEAFLEIFTSTDTVNTRIYTNNKISKTFTSKINSLDFKNSILTIYNAFAQKQPTPAQEIQKISQVILDEPLGFISDDQITKLKIRINDFYLSLIPASQLVFNKNDLGQMYTLSLVGLGNNLGINTNVSGNIEAFAATKGNSHFSKLPGAKKEIEALRAISLAHPSNQNKFYLDSEFNQASFINSFSKKPNIIHVATHFQASGNTSGSTKMLLGDGSEMSLDELRVNLPIINTKLITLSACDTGALIPQNANQSFLGSSYFEGLSSTFQTKGAENVIATLWSIDDDATSDFMGIFYTLLLNNNISPNEALHLTQNVFRSQSIEVLPSNIYSTQKRSLEKFTKKLDQYSNPYYWAAFQIYSIN